VLPVGCAGVEFREGPCLYLLLDCYCWAIKESFGWFIIRCCFYHMTLIGEYPLEGDERRLWDLLFSRCDKHVM